MQKIISDYTRVILWSTVLLIIIEPGYLAFDALFRQSRQVEVFKEERIVRGSYFFASSQCWTCHGFNGEGGIGLPLNKTEEIRTREAKEPFIEKTIARGRYSTQMPKWLKEEGGPLDIEEIRAIREFILDGKHWGKYYDIHPVVIENGKVIEGRLGVKAWKDTKDYLKDHALLPPCEEKDLVCKGKIVFSGPCAACHNTTAETKVGPGLAGIFKKANLPNNKPVNDANMTEWLQKGSASYKAEGQPFMPPYETQVRGDDLKNLIEYLKTLN